MKNTTMIVVTMLSSSVFLGILFGIVLLTINEVSNEGVSKQTPHYKQESLHSESNRMFSVSTQHISPYSKDFTVDVSGTPSNEQLIRFAESLNTSSADETVVHYPPVDATVTLRNDEHIGELTRVCIYKSGDLSKVLMSSTGSPSPDSLTTFDFAQSLPRSVENAVGEREQFTY